ncbi:probable cation-transporting ATPase 13A3 [Nilaparvata lugens]|uniref:probable cation-transporting ATPase 13A3 n=1 Tax=Nilaparvata lugens TaxID=108931 RepID=UPI00193E7025|nr:probable cation-transporting ATPase 13A3 [Nilaparvata lugens]
MPATPTNLKLGFQRNNYSRVSFGRNSDSHAKRKESSGPDAQPLQGDEYAELHGLQSGIDYINAGTDEQMEVYGYCRNKVKTVVTWLLIVVTLGGLRLVFHWWPRYMLYATHSVCPLHAAHKVIIIERYQKKSKRYFVKDIKTLTAQSLRQEVEVDQVGVDASWNQQAAIQLNRVRSPKLSIHVSGGHFKDVDEVRMFCCKKVCYIWDADKGEFSRLQGLDYKITTQALHRQVGLTLVQQYLRRAVYGRNEIIVPLKGVMTLLFLEVLDPFYVFQIFSFILWFIDDYIQYATAIFFLTTSSIVMNTIQNRRNQRKIRSTVHSTDVIEVVRAGGEKNDQIPTEMLVPGDLLLIPANGCVMQCDAVLLTGTCVVIENALTGESVPVIKTPLPNSSTVYFDEKEHSLHTLFCGTKVLQTRYYGNELVYAVVIRTGFGTFKGRTVRAILYPPPADYRFEQDSYKFVALLAAIASLGFVYTVVTKAMRGVKNSEIALDALDLITIVVPPALPTAMTVGRIYAQKRLKKKNIYCISPRTINVSGSVNCVCFDKTGTLTEDGLDMWGVVPVEQSAFLPAVKQLPPTTSHLLAAMATCHSLLLIDGAYSGDPIDLKMFESTGWTFEDPEVNDTNKFDLIFPTIARPPKSANTEKKTDVEIAILQRFAFSSILQRMSIICRALDAHEFTVYCKGSPEMIQSLCNPDTVPVDFSKQLEEFTQEGYRVLGLAYRNLAVTYHKACRLEREEIETDLCFLGLVVMENRLKPETTGVIKVLKDANIRTVMVTGDNMLTALSVARDCGIVSLGQRVITVNSKLKPGDQVPQIYYSETNHPVPTFNMAQGNSSQMTATNSIFSLDTSESLTAITPVTANGTARNSIMTDVEMPVDNKVICSNDYGSPSNFVFSLTGSVWSLIRDKYPELMPKIVTRGAVFSRMTPDQKQELVEELKSLGYYVAMCGDGANDCGALKAAHTGVSLSDAESSIAAPFRSRDVNIQCVVQVVREGRAALVTSFAIFKYMAAYSLVQFISVMILYSIDSNLSDFQYLFIDLFLITAFAYVISQAGAYKGALVPHPPQTSLISMAPIVSLVGQMLIAYAFQLASFYSVQNFEWFQPYNATDAPSVECHENYAVFTISSLQYIILAVVFAKGPPYRKSILTNWSLLLVSFLSCLLVFYLILEPPELLRRKFDLVMPEGYSFRLIVLALGVSNFLIASIHEFFVCDYLLFQKLRERRKEMGIIGDKKKYLEMEREMRADAGWPVLSGAGDVSTPANTKCHTPRSPLTVMRVNANGSAFTFPTDSVMRSSGDMSDVTATLPRQHNGLPPPPHHLPRYLSQSSHITQSEDSLSHYLTPPESFHSSAVDIQ